MLKNVGVSLPSDNMTAHSQDTIQVHPPQAQKCESHPIRKNISSACSNLQAYVSTTKPRSLDPHRISHLLSAVDKNLDTTKGSIITPALESCLSAMNTRDPPMNRFWAVQSCVISILARIAGSISWSDSLLQTIASTAWRHNKMPLVLDMSEETPSVFLNSSTVPPFTTRRAVLTIVMGGVQDGESPGVVDDVLDLIMRELKYRKCKIEESRRTLFNTLVTGTYRWQKIVPMGVEVKTASIADQDSYICDCFELVLALIRKREPCLPGFELVLDMGMEAIVEKMGELEAVRMRQCVSEFSSLRRTLENSEIIT